MSSTSNPAARNNNRPDENNQEPQDPNLIHAQRNQQQQIGNLLNLQQAQPADQANNAQPQRIDPLPVDSVTITQPLRNNASPSRAHYHPNQNSAAQERVARASYTGRQNHPADIGSNSNVFASNRRVSGSYTRDEQQRPSGEGFGMGSERHQRQSYVRPSSNEPHIYVDTRLLLEQKGKMVLRTANMLLTIIQTLQFVLRIAFWAIGVLLLLALLGRLLFTKALRVAYNNCIEDNGSFCIWKVWRAFFSADNLSKSPRLSMKLSSSGLPNANNIFEVGFPVAHDNTVLLLITFMTITALRFLLDRYHNFLINTIEISAMAANVPLPIRIPPARNNSNFLPLWFI